MVQTHLDFATPCTDLAFDSAPVKKLEGFYFWLTCLEDIVENQHMLSGSFRCASLFKKSTCQRLSAFHLDFLLFRLKAQHLRDHTSQTWWLLSQVVELEECWSSPTVSPKMQLCVCFLFATAERFRNRLTPLLLCLTGQHSSHLVKHGQTSYQYLASLIAFHIKIWRFNEETATASALHLQHISAFTISTPNDWWRSAKPSIRPSLLACNLDPPKANSDPTWKARTHGCFRALLLTDIYTA